MPVKQTKLAIVFINGIPCVSINAVSVAGATLIEQANIIQHGPGRTLTPLANVVSDNPALQKWILSKI
jgi:hypothetical protein